jgi:hypothetical protein
MGSVRDRRPILFVSWTPHARVTAVAADLGAEVVVPAAGVRGWPWPLRYLLQSVAMTAALARKRPRSVIFTNPPFLTGVALLATRPLLRFSLWADCHSGAFNDPRWSRYSRLNAAVLRRCDGVVFHNSAQASEYGSICRRHIIIWSPRIVDRRTSQTGGPRAGGDPDTGRPTVVAPVTYAFDEPVAELLLAAADCPEIDLVLTGAAPEFVRHSAPSNVRFTGWVSDAEYQSVLSAADAILCLTTRPGTMQQTLAEAVEHGKPTVVSGTVVLREWRGEDEIAVFVRSHDPRELCAAMRAAVAARPGPVAERNRQAIIERSAAHITRLSEMIHLGDESLEVHSSQQAASWL